MTMPLSILLVEDNPGDARLIQLGFVESGLDVALDHVDRIDKAVSLFAEKAFDVVILDLSLPDGKGFGTFSKIHTHAPGTPIVVLTGLDDESLAEDLAGAGAQDYLVKDNVSPRILRRVIRYAIERKRAEKELRLAAKIFEGTLESIIVTDENLRVQRINTAFSQITGYTQKEVLGWDLTRFHADSQDSAFFKAVQDILAESGQWQGEIINRRKNGEAFPAWMNISVIPNEAGHAANYVAVFTEITELKLSQERVRHLSRHDALTGLPNRMPFGDRLEHSLAQAHRNNTSLAAVFMDLDRFKIINDTLGHSEGDELLNQVAQRLKSCSRGSDTLARLGGDEFALILEDFADEDAVAKVAEKILHELSQPLTVGEHEVFITASLGIAFHHASGGDEEGGDEEEEDPAAIAEESSTLLKNADVAMYRAKENGRGNYQFYSSDMDEEALERLKLETSLRHALDREEFVLHYQPQIDSATNAIQGVEALLRWQHPEMGLVPPARIIPILEETGMIVAVGEWVLRSACRQAKAWQDEGFPLMRMAVNISPRQFKHPDFIRHVTDALDETELDPSYLELELTESMVIENVDETARILEEFKEMGVRIAIDDFGDGASSISYLKNFPISTLKISHSFVIDIATDRDDAAIASMLIDVAKNMDLTSIAEGVETDEQLDCLKERQCKEVQGYIYRRPLASADFAKYLRKRLSN